MQILMALKKPKVAKSFSKSEVAKFERRRVFGTPRYYPQNDFAQEIINLKSAMAQQNRKRFIKCLSQREIELVQNLGISVEIRVLA